MITNKAPYPVVLKSSDVDGQWQTPLSSHVSQVIEPNQAYVNTLVPLKKDSGLDSFVSIDVAQVDNQRENYVIWGESSDFGGHDISAHIFDGLGRLFVSSVTNHCDSVAADGMRVCTLIVRE